MLLVFVTGDSITLFTSPTVKGCRHKWQLRPLSSNWWRQSEQSRCPHKVNIRSTWFCQHIVHSLSRRSLSFSADNHTDTMQRYLTNPIRPCNHWGSLNRVPALIDWGKGGSRKCHFCRVAGNTALSVIPYGTWVTNCWTAIYPVTLLYYIILCITFSQTRSNTGAWCGKGCYLFQCIRMENCAHTKKILGIGLLPLEMIILVHFRII